MSILLDNVIMGDPYVKQTRPGSLEPISPGHQLKQQYHIIFIRKTRCSETCV
jgi:hypothetical protein